VSTQNLPSVKGSPRAALMKLITSNDIGAAPVTQTFRLPPKAFLALLKNLYKTKSNKK